MTTRPDSATRPDLSGYEVLVCVCGGIAAYKVCEVVSALVQRGVGVTVAMTKAGRRFVGTATFQALTGHGVLTSLWSRDEPADVQHIRPTDSADLVLIAPATANIIAKAAVGLADDLVSTLLLSVASPVLVAPAMNDRMWSNAIVQRNVATLTERGFHFVGPGRGWLACRSVGPGRMAEPDEILDVAAAMLKKKRPPSGAEPS